MSALPTLPRLTPFTRTLVPFSSLPLHSPLPPLPHLARLLTHPIHPGIPELHLLTLLSLILDPLLQHKSQKVGLYDLAKEAQFPVWIVEVRHKIVHSEGKRMKKEIVEKAVRETEKWIRKRTQIRYYLEDDDTSSREACEQTVTDAHHVTKPVSTKRKYERLDDDDCLQTKSTIAEHERSAKAIKVSDANANNRQLERPSLLQSRQLADKVEMSNSIEKPIPLRPLWELCENWKPRPFGVRL